MTTQSTLNEAQKMKSSEIFAAIDDNPSLLADVLNLDPDLYTFTITGTFIEGPKNIQYAKHKKLIDGPTMRLVTINDVLLRSNVLLDKIVGYTSFEGIACVVFEHQLTSSIQPPVNPDPLATDNDPATQTTATSQTEEAEDDSDSSGTEDNKS